MRELCLFHQKKLLVDAERQKYAVPAFNFYNLDTLIAVINAAQAERSPIIAQIYFSHFTYYNRGSSIAASALELIRQSPMPIALYLDHSTSYTAVLRAIRCGFNSVMIDGSTLPLDENISITPQVTEIGRKLGIYTEADLGHATPHHSPGQGHL